MGLEIKNETVYVIYYDDKPYNTSGRKIVYTSKGAAKGVITNDVNKEVTYSPEIHNLSSSEVDEALKKELGKYKIVEYTPKEN